MIIAGGHGDIRGGTKWIGTDGWVSVDRGGFDASNIDWFQKLPDSCTSGSTTPTITKATSSVASSRASPPSPPPKPPIIPPSPATLA